MVNGRIRAAKILLIDESQNQVGVVDVRQALTRAQDEGLDLVEVGPQSNPPVCRIMDYGKWLYRQKRKSKDSSKKSQKHSSRLKEIRLRPETEEHDLGIKLEHACKFLEKGYKVQFTIQFRGRQLLHKEIGYQMMDEIKERLEDLAKVISPCKMTGRRMILVFAPK